MNLKNQPPIFVDERFRAELEKMSKAALMDLVWDFATTSSETVHPNSIMKTIRERRDIVLTHRQNSRAEQVKS